MHNHTSRPRGYVAYVRVSTARQEATGVSLSEQRLAIAHYANTQGLRVAKWYTETRTGAQRNRPVFREVLKSLTKGHVKGLLIHRIDRGARNLGDWARIGELLDSGADVRFIHDGLDLHSRGGRLAADIQAVIAADFVRNLREETRKGIRGRLRQGLRPGIAPFGYLNTGRGRPKLPDPARAPIVREAFSLYATGAWTLETLAVEMYGRGVRGSSGKAITLNGWSHMLRNRFYVGELRVAGTNEMLPGIHEPLVSTETFERVQTVLRHRRRRRATVRHVFRYRGLLRCATCRKLLTGERQKGHVYYRCHQCRGVCVREERAETP